MSKRLNYKPPTHPQEVQETIKAFRKAIGQQVTVVKAKNPRAIILHFTEQGASETLRKLGAPPIPENRLPSKTKTGDRTHLCALLGIRIRRAAQVGYAGRTASWEIQQSQTQCAALTLNLQELQELTRKLQAPQSQLAGLIEDPKDKTLGPVNSHK